MPTPLNPTVCRRRRTSRCLALVLEALCATGPFAARALPRTPSPPLPLPQRALPVAAMARPPGVQPAAEPVAASVGERFGERVAGPARELVQGSGGLWPQRTSVRLAPDGRRLAWVEASPDGGVRVRTAPLAEDGGLGEMKDGPSDAHRVEWAADSRGLFLVLGGPAQPVLASRDGGAPSGPRLVYTDLERRRLLELSPPASAGTELLATQVAGRSRELVVAAARAGTGLTDVLRVDLGTGRARLDTRNPGDVERWLLDADGAVRGAVARLANGFVQLRVRDGRRAGSASALGPWRALVTASADTVVTPIGFAADGRSLYLETTIASDVRRLVEKGLATGTERTVAYERGASVVAMAWSAPQRLPLAVRFDAPGEGVEPPQRLDGGCVCAGPTESGARPTAWRALEYTAAADFRALEAGLGTSDFAVESADRADALWIVRAGGAQRLAYWLWDRRARRLTELFSGG